MTPRKPLTHDLRNRIMEYKKTRVDIADLLVGYDLRNEDLSYCYISILNVPDEDISGANFSGTEMKFMGQKCIARGCNFIATVFLPGSSMRGGDFRDSNFTRASFPHIDYAYADLRGCNLCGAALTFSTRLGFKSKLSQNIIEIMEKWYAIQPGAPMKDEAIE